MNVAKVATCSAILALAVSLPLAEGLAASEQNCRRYAEGAVKDFDLGTNSANARHCRIQPDGRWQSNYQNHYKWCLAVPDASWRSEEKARNDRLLACQARVRFD